MSSESFQKLLGYSSLYYVVVLRQVFGGFHETLFRVFGCRDAFSASSSSLRSERAGNRLRFRAQFAKASGRHFSRGSRGGGAEFQGTHVCVHAERRNAVV